MSPTARGQEQEHRDGGGESRKVWGQGRLQVVGLIRSAISTGDFTVEFIRKRINGIRLGITRVDEERSALGGEKGVPAV